MFWEVLGFVFTSILFGIIVLYKITGDIFPRALKTTLTRTIVTNWIKSLPQNLPIHNTKSPKSTFESGLCASDSEWEIETPKSLSYLEDVDTALIYGIDDKGNAVVVKYSKTFRTSTQVDIIIRKNKQAFTASVKGFSNNDKEFSIGNFKLELVEPFRVWRIWYNGPMGLEGANNHAKNLVHVTLNFLWKPLENPFDHRKNANIELLSSYMSENGIFGAQLPSLTEALPKGFYQFGSMHGIMKVNASEDELYLYGYRQRRHRNRVPEYNQMELFAMKDEDGDALRLANYKDGWIDGVVSYPSFQNNAITQVDCNAGLFLKDSTLPKLFELKDKKSVHRIQIWPKYDSIDVSKSLNITLLEIDINGKSSHGILLRNIDTIMGDFDTGTQMHLALQPLHPNQLNLDSEFLDLGSPLCSQVELVGGKGASLAKLASLNKEIKTFKTARGFCCTTTLFRRMVDTSALTSIFTKEDENVEDMCTKAKNLIKTSGAEQKISAEVNSLLTKVFGTTRGQMRFAVRSSGVLEDASDLSCAGQNETFLGITEEFITVKIIECWASLFTLQSVKYRLNHGQPAVSEMGVVVQEMINPTTAGVLFTADPRTGNPFEMLLTANYGLGESVVSASCDPDTINILRTKIKDSSCLEIGTKTVGLKQSKVVMSSSGETFTEECHVDEKDSAKLCISDTHVLSLGSIGVDSETALGQQKPVDIEWGISENGDIYILQSRAMTSLDAWTDFEIIHQFDSSLRTRIEQNTTANTGEVLPKPLFTISTETLARVLHMGTQNSHETISGTRTNPIVARCIELHGQRCFVNTYASLYRQVDANLTPATDCVDLSIFGRPVIDQNTHQIALKRYGCDTAFGKINGLIQAIKVIRNVGKIVEQSNSKLGNWTFTVESKEKSAKLVYAQITMDLLKLKDITFNHCATSQAGGAALIFVFLALTEGKKSNEWPPSLYEDAGKLLSAYSEVESAEMPTDMDHLGDQILKRGNVDAFLESKSITDTIQILRESDDLRKSLDSFLAKHGHRSVAELDIGQISWREDPTPFIKLLKSIVRNKEKNHQPSTVETPKFNLTNDEELLNSLKTPLKNGSKRFLKFVLPSYRKTVSSRERTKSILVRVVDQIRQAYNQLAELMVRENFIPDKSFIRHLAHSEIKLLLEKDPSSASILYKAIRRQRLYPSLLEHDYPEISIGLPKPIDLSLAVETTDVLKGTPVSSGKVKGIAKVCLSVEDASMLLDQGDILITKATDIAWSPFFPMLGGVVTELGGLISHGAVVAREYGLPCLVGAVSATKIFATGDEVILDTGIGTLSKVKV